MSLSLGIAQLALLTRPSGTTTRQSVHFSGSSQTWQQKSLASSLSSRVRPNSRGGWTFAIKGLSADYVAAEGELAKESIVDNTQVSHRRRPAPRAAPHRTFEKFWRRFPGSAQWGPEDVTVPAEALRRGAVFTGMVSSIQPFGAFVRFGAFADGLIHISKLGTGYVKDVSDVVELGQEVLVRILNVEEATGRISLAVVEKEELDLRKPYLSPRREEARQRRERSRFQAGWGRSSALSEEEKEERVWRGPNVPSSGSMESREGGERPRFQQGPARRSPFVVEEGENNARNPIASTRLREAGEERRSRNPLASARQWGAGDVDRMSRKPSVSSRERESGEKDTMSRNPFASSIQSEGGEEDRMSRNSFGSVRRGGAREEDRNPFASSRQREVREERSGLRFQQGKDGKYQGPGRVSRLRSGADREEQRKPKMKLVDIRSYENSDNQPWDEKVSSPMRSVMRSWYECECCY